MPETPQPSPEGTPAQTQTGTLVDQNPTLLGEGTPKSEGIKLGAKAPSLLNEGAPEGGAAKDVAPEPKATAGAPDKYEAFTAPEGLTLDPAGIEKALPIFKELGLSQEAGQKLINLYAEQTQAAIDAPYRLWKETQDSWINEIKSDADLGGKLDLVKETVGRALDSLGDPKLKTDFKAAMDLTGAGNNPAFVRAFYKLSQAVTEGKPVSGRPAGQSAAKPTAAQAIYPSLPSQGNP